MRKIGYFMYIISSAPAVPWRRMEEVDETDEVLEDPENPFVRGRIAVRP